MGKTFLCCGELGLTGRLSACMVSAQIQIGLCDSLSAERPSSVPHNGGPPTVPSEVEESLRLGDWITDGLSRKGSWDALPLSILPYFPAMDMWLVMFSPPP